MHPVFQCMCVTDNACGAAGQGRSGNIAYVWHVMSQQPTGEAEWVEGRSARGIEAEWVEGRSARSIEAEWVEGRSARGIKPWELHRNREIHSAPAQDGHAQHRAREDFVERQQ